MTNTPQNAPGPDYGQGNKYGTAAYSPQQSFDQGKPAKVGTLRQVAIGLLILSVISSVFSMILSRTQAFQNDMIEYFKGVGLSAEQAEQSVQGGFVGPLLGLVVTVALYVVVIAGLSKEKNWARILGIVLAILSIVGMIGAFGIGAVTGVPLMAGGALGAVSLVLTVVQLALTIYWLVLAFNGRVAEWFKSAR
ncbi:hypothetical protein GCM10009594_20590 [Kocuria palustris]|uniref:hypothetical protein n=1 Tax=Kocuria palustris TaxID=71999 RepID=UPI001958F462|nr:hypothetical protein [Kocuria palustris]MBM7823186.1 membrane-associated HD superfamily phosphohydrolase [Kocuria palustris]